MVGQCSVAKNLYYQYRCITLKLVLIGNGLAGMRCLEEIWHQIVMKSRWLVKNLGEPYYVVSGFIGWKNHWRYHPPKWYDDKGIKFIAGDKKLIVHVKWFTPKKGKLLTFDFGNRFGSIYSTSSRCKGVLTFRDIYDVNTMIEYQKLMQSWLVVVYSV